jgi:hypothetical protein
MKLNWILLGLVIFVGIPSTCAAKKKKKVVKPKTTKIETPLKNPKVQPNTFSTLSLCSNDYSFPNWRLAIVRGFVFPKNMQAPSQFRLATINDTALTQYLQSIPFDFEKPQKKKIQIPIYKNGLINCKEYRIERVVTMDSALQAKYPMLMSFKAYDPENPLNTARIDCDGKNTKIMITDDSEIYFVTPILFNKNTFYACYAKSDPNFKKDDFEKNKR